MTTKASKVEFFVIGTGDIFIDWGDGKKNSNLNDAFYDEPHKQFVFTREYSGTTPRNIAINGNITRLDCTYNGLTDLNVSGCAGLRSLTCYTNTLTTLDVSKNTALEELLLDNNQLTNLDVSNNTALKILSCDDNRLIHLNLSVANTALFSLYCAYNQLTASALNDLFRALPDLTKNEGYDAVRNPGQIFIQGNSGSAVSNQSIALEKGWKFGIYRNRL